MRCTGSLQVVKQYNMYKRLQKLQGRILVFISAKAVSYPFLEFLGHSRASQKHEIEQMNQ